MAEISPQRTGCVYPDGRKVCWEHLGSGECEVVCLLNGAATRSPLREYIYSGSQLVAGIEGGATKYDCADPLPARFTTNARGITCLIIIGRINM